MSPLSPPRRYAAVIANPLQDSTAMIPRRLSTLALLALLGACSADKPPVEASPAASTVADPAAEPPRAEALATPAAPPAPARPAQEATALQAAAREQMAIAAQRRAERRRWWGDAALASAIGLSEAQQQAMDAHFSAWQREQQLTANAVQAAQRDYTQALRANQLERAQQAAQERATQVARQSLAQQQLTLDLLGELSASQRETVIADFARRVSGDLGREGRGRDGQGRREGDAGR